MNRDRSWMNHNGVKDRRKQEYKVGVDGFLEFAFRDKNDEAMLKCPCLDCRLRFVQNRKTMQCHLFVFGIDSTYNPWFSHGEVEELNSSSEDENIERILGSEGDTDGEDEIIEGCSTRVNDETPKVFGIEGARQPKKFGIEGGNNEIRADLSLEIQQLKEAAALHETQIATLTASNEVLKSSNEELKASVTKINLDAIEREKNLRVDMLRMFDEMREGTNGVI